MHRITSLHGKHYKKEITVQLHSAVTLSTRSDRITCIYDVLSNPIQEEDKSHLNFQGV